MAQRFDRGGTVTIGYTYRQLTNAAAGRYVAYDPAVPTARVQRPDGTITTYTMANQQMAHVIEGVTTVGYYELTLACDQEGPWKWAWLDPDPARPDVTYGAFIVKPPPF